MNTSSTGKQMLNDTTPSSATRLGTASDAQATVQTLMDDQKPRVDYWAEWKGMLDGNPPVSPSEKAMNNRRWESNFNTLTGKGLLDNAITPYFSLFANGAYLADVQLDADNVDVAEQRSRIVRREFCHMLRRHGDMMDSFLRLCYSFVGFGKGYWMWPTPYQWRPSVKMWYELLFPRDTPTDPKEWTLFCVKNDLTPSTLYGYIRNEESARQAGWNPAAVRRAISRANLPEDRNEDALRLQAQLREHDLTTSCQLKSVNTAYVYACEWDGTWSLGVVERDHAGSEKEPLEYLFFKKGVTEDIYDLICPFYFTTEGNGVNGVDGLARQIFGSVSVADLMTNKIVDGALLRALALLAPTTQSSSVKGGITQVGNVMMLPWGFNAQPATVLADITGPIAAHRHLDTLISKNTGVWRPSAEREIGNPASATENQLRAQAQTRLNASGVERFYNYGDHAYQTIYRRALKAAEDPRDTPDRRAAREFLKRCKDQGVTKDMLKDPLWVGAHRVVGAGSTMQQQDSFARMMPFVGAMPGRGLLNFQEDYTAATADSTKIERWFPRDADEAGEGVWEAQVESGLANQGVPPVWTSGQDQVAHATTHLQQLALAFASAQQGADPVTTFNYVTVMMQHTEQTVAAVAKDQTQAQRAKQMTVQLRILAQQMPGLEAAARKQMEDAQVAQQAAMVQQGLDPDMQLKAAKAQSQMQLREQRQQHEQGLKLAQTQQDMAIKAAQARQQMEIEAAQTAASIQNKRVESAAKVQAAANKPSNQST